MTILDHEMRLVYPSVVPGQGVVYCLADDSLVPGVRRWLKRSFQQLAEPDREQHARVRAQLNRTRPARPAADTPSLLPGVWTVLAILVVLVLVQDPTTIFTSRKRKRRPFRRLRFRLVKEVA